MCKPMCNKLLKQSTIISPAQEDESSMHASDDHAPIVSSVNDNGQSEWISIEESHSPPHDIHFSGESGVNPAIALNKDSLPVEFFDFFITDKILKLMVKETNRYTNELLSNSIAKDKSTLKRWVNTTNTKMETYIGLLFIWVW